MSNTTDKTIQLMPVSAEQLELLAIHARLRDILVQVYAAMSPATTRSPMKPR